MEFLLPIQMIVNYAPFYILVLFRMGGIMVFAPLLGSVAIPIPIKALVALVLSAAVFPLLDLTGLSALAVMPTNMIDLAFGVARELLIGLVMGFALYLMFVGIQVGGEMISQQMALSISRIIDPFTNVSTDILSQFYLLLATMLYVLMNGHLILIETLVGTFQTVPLLGASFDQTILETLLSILTAAFMLGIRIAGPAVAAIFLATIALGFISRTMPQLNILAAGFPIRILLALTLLIASLGTVCSLFEESVLGLLSGLGQLFV